MNSIPPGQRAYEQVGEVPETVYGSDGPLRPDTHGRHQRGSEGVKVEILLDDDTQADLSGVDQRQLGIVFNR